MMTNDDFSAAPLTPPLAPASPRRWLLLSTAVLSLWTLAGCGREPTASGDEPPAPASEPGSKGKPQPLADPAPGTKGGSRIVPEKEEDVTGLSPEQRWQSWERRLAATDEALRHNPKDSQAFISRGRVWMEMRHYEAAREAFTQALRHDPQQARATALRGASQQRLGKNEAALADLDAALRIEPGDTGLLIRRAHVYRELGLYKEGLADAEEVLKLLPKSAPTYNARGRIYRALKEKVKADKDFETALELDPNSAETFYNIAYGHYEGGAYGVALRYVELGLKADPEYEALHCLAGQAHGKAGNDAKAFHAYSRAIDLTPFYTLALNNRGNALIKAGQFDLALVDLTRVVRSNPTYRLGYGNRMICAEKLGLSMLHLRDKVMVDAIDYVDRMKKELRETIGRANLGAKADPKDKTPPAVLLLFIAVGVKDLGEYERYTLARVALAEGGVPVNEPAPKGGRTALHFACERANFPLVKLLLDHGADAGIKDDAGKTPFDLLQAAELAKLDALKPATDVRKTVLEKMQVLYDKGLAEYVRESTEVKIRGALEAAVEARTKQAGELKRRSATEVKIQDAEVMALTIAAANPAYNRKELSRREVGELGNRFAEDRSRRNVVLTDSAAALTSQLDLAIWMAELQYGTFHPRYREVVRQASAIARGDGK